MQNVIKLPAAKSLEALEQAFAYYTPSRTVEKSTQAHDIAYGFDKAS